MKDTMCLQISMLIISKKERKKKKKKKPTLSRICYTLLGIVHIYIFIFHFPELDSFILKIQARLK